MIVPSYCLPRQMQAPVRYPVDLHNQTVQCSTPRPFEPSTTFPGISLAHVFGVSINIVRLNLARNASRFILIVFFLDVQFYFTCHLLHINRSCLLSFPSPPEFSIGRFKAQISSLNLPRKSRWSLLSKENPVLVVFVLFDDLMGNPC